MTNEEAINILIAEKATYCFFARGNAKSDEPKILLLQALDMAISALSKTPSETEIRTEESAEYFNKSEVLEMLEKINKAVEDGEGYQFNEWGGYVKELPTEEVQPIVHGKCSIAYGMYENRIWCNNCGFIKVITGNENEYNFCPKCGTIVEKQNEMTERKKNK